MKTTPPVAPAILKGIQAVDPKTLLAKATSEQIKALTYTNLALWCQITGIEVDQHKFDFDSHRYLLPIYLDDHHEIVWIKAAQLGATVYMLLRLLWFCRHYKLKAGLYFPTADGVSKLSKDRLTPLVQSNPELYLNIANDADTLNLKQIDNIHGGRSSLYMMYLGGQSSKDSVPLDVIGFDEVRLVKDTDIDQALERISHSSMKYKMFMSTAGFPSQDIHKRFLAGTQHTWHTRCLCSDGIVLSDAFPDCIAVTDKEIYLRCPKCKTRIQDPQNGMYIPHNPKADTHSYHVSQLVSKFISPKEIWDFYTKTSNLKEFYNAKLGRPYVDEENQPITEDILENCVNPDLKWAYDIAAPKYKRTPLAMGVDQMGGYNYVLIGRHGPDGKKQLIHAEIIESDNPMYWENGKPVSPFKRLHELMREFDISMCVIDALPNHNEAMELARAFPARVFLAFYGEAGQDMVRWLDKLKPKEAIKRGSKEIKLKWQVVMNRYMTMDYALRVWQERGVEIAHPMALTQVVRNEDTGRFEAEPIVKTRLWKHLGSMVRQKEVIDEETGKFKMSYIYIGRDPHFSHSWNYLNIALERLKRRGIIAI